MKILLTGATGYIGRRLKERLLQDERIELRVLVCNKKAFHPLSKSVLMSLRVIVSIKKHSKRHSMG
jgi:uncharacterized protein YbjT (DUF2867 family)